ncbi:CRISPR-associated helicase Cas3', partial [Myxococcota bacterium]|nr:CRISPR-associated helicase Cas3' [Myxococcota bacterium]
MPRYTPWAKRIEHPRIELPRVEHPLIAHAADVAACAHVLLTQSLLARRLAAFANQDTLNASQIDALTRLAAWHDLGKCNHKFQSGRGGHVGEIIDLFRAPTHRPQGKRLADALPRDLDEPYFYAAFAHHGWPKNRNDRNDMALWAPKDGYDPLDEVERIIQASARWCPQADFSALPENEALVHALNGLITLADWVGSDTRFFPFEPEADADARYHASLARAEAAMRQIGLISPTRPAAEGLTFSAISPFPPRAAQAALWDLPTTAPSLTILEAATGSGKTEAALGRFLQLFAAGEVDGLYFALPTRAAATQLHRRVYQAIQRALGPAAPPVILAVPGYHRVDEADGHALPDYKVRWDDPQDRLRGWASEHSKRFLGAAIAVGTIDQALLSALQVKHTHLRGLPLLRNLLVVDEVHASDVYMARLLKAVLNRQIKAGGHALLLSATLGAQRRLELLNAERSLKKKDKPKHAEARVAAYPLLTYRAGDAQGQIAPGDVTTPKAVRLQPRPWMDDHAALAQAALAHAARGARVLIIRNTVNDCRQTQIALEALDPAPLLHCQGVPTCHHARYAPSDRQLLDAAVEAALDPHRPAPQPGAAGVIIVATQTVEQSLDIDADHLITDLCPM